ncbi:MAG: hypothetical protein QW472_00950 [Candidatus Aenigmatarchaeota archaeon]
MVKKRKKWKDTKERRREYRIRIGEIYNMDRTPIGAIELSLCSPPTVVTSEDEGNLYKYFGNSNTNPDLLEETSDSKKSNYPLIYQIIDRIFEEKITGVKKDIETMNKELQEIKELLKKLYEKPVPESEKIKTTGSEAISSNVITSTQPSTGVKKLSEKEIEKILRKYDTSNLMNIKTVKDYSNMLGTSTLKNLNLGSKKIEKEYTPEQLKQIIQYARENKYHPASYAAIVRACMDNDLERCSIPGLELTEEELKYAKMPRGLPEKSN